MSWLPKKSVVVPIDFSDESFEALATARQLVDDPAALHLVHVLPVLEPTEPGVVWDTVSDTGRREHAERVLRERLQDPAYAGVNIAIAIGDPGTEITRLAQAAQAELIVLSSHGRTGLKRLLIGSVAERVIRLARCPVLVLRK